MTTDRGGDATAGVPLPREAPFVTVEVALAENLVGFV